MSLQPREAELCSAITAQRSLEYLEELISLGDRFVGTKGDAAAAELVARRMEELGLTIHERAFTTPGYEASEARLTLAGTNLQLVGLPPYFAPAPPEGEIEAEILYVGDGSPDSYADVDVTGRILAMHEPGTMYERFWLGAFADVAAARGAVGLVVVHPLPWAYRMSMEAGNGDLDNRFPSMPMPAVCLGAQDGLRLMHEIGRGGVVARLAYEASMPTVESRNVSGTVLGEELPDQTVIVHAHRDHGIFPGANDNGSGVATLLQVARATAGARPRRTLEFLCTSAEEGVTKGVAEYVRQRQEDGSLDQIKAAVNLDMIGVGGRLKLVEDAHWPDTGAVPHTPWMIDLFEDVAGDLGYDVGRMTSPWGVAESGRFIEAGVPAAWFWKPDDPYYHSREDTADKVDGNALKAMGDITTVGIWRMSEATHLARVDD